MRNRVQIGCKNEGKENLIQKSTEGTSTNQIHGSQGPLEIDREIEVLPSTGKTRGTGRQELGVLGFGDPPPPPLATFGTIDETTSVYISTFNFLRGRACNG